MWFCLLKDKKDFNESNAVNNATITLYIKLGISALYYFNVVT